LLGRLAPARGQQDLDDRLRHRVVDVPRVLDQRRRRMPTDRYVRDDFVE